MAPLERNFQNLGHQPKFFNSLIISEELTQDFLAGLYYIMHTPFVLKEEKK